MLLRCGFVGKYCLIINQQSLMDLLIVYSQLLNII